jgi:hypothetical protein
MAVCRRERGGGRKRGARDAAVPVLKGAGGGEGKKGGVRSGVPRSRQRKEGGLA